MGVGVIETVFRVNIEYPGDEQPIIEICNTFKYATRVAEEHANNGAIVTIDEEIVNEKIS